MWTTLFYRQRLVCHLDRAAAPGGIWQQLGSRRCLHGGARGPSGAGHCFGTPSVDLNEFPGKTLHAASRRGSVYVQVSPIFTSGQPLAGYSYGSSTLLYATVGERSPVLPVKAGSGVPPTRILDHVSTRFKNLQTEHSTSDKGFLCRPRILSLLCWQCICF